MPQRSGVGFDPWHLGSIGMAAEAFTHLLAPSTDLDQSFAGFRSRGVLVAGEALIVASIALALGAILGRAVPTFVLAVMLAGAIGIAVDKVERQLLTNEAAIADVESYQTADTDLVLDNRLRFPDGTILSWEEAFQTHPELQNGFDDVTGPRGVVFYIPGSRYHDVERRDALVLLALAAAFIGRRKASS